MVAAMLMMVAAAAAAPQSYPSESSAKPSYDDVRTV